MQKAHCAFCTQSVRLAALAFFLFSSILYAPPVRAHAVLAPGDVVLVGIETSDGVNPGAVTLGMLASLHLDGVVELTDSGLYSDGTFRVTEGGAFLEALRMPIPRGSVLRLDAGTMSLGGRDQVSIYEGVIEPSGILRGGRLTFQATWGGPFESECTGDTSSTLSPGLGLGSIALPMSAEAFVYVGRTSGTRVEILTQIHDAAFWRATTRALFSPPTSFDVTPVRGEACASASECASGYFCVDDVCCDTACGGGLASDCLSCNFGARPQTGTCGLVGPDHLCRASRGYCDIPEACDGITSACPADRLVPSGFTCRPVRDACDLVELCDGTSIDCPTDAVAGPERTCREAVDPCDLAEQCDGALSCPPDLHGCFDAGPSMPDAGLDAGPDASTTPDAFMRPDAGPRDAGRRDAGRRDASQPQDASSELDASSSLPQARQCNCSTTKPRGPGEWLVLGCIVPILLGLRRRSRDRKWLNTPPAKRSACVERD